MEGLKVSGIGPRSNGSPEGDRFIEQWNRSVLSIRELESQRRSALRKIGITRVIPNDGWVKRVDGTPISIPFKHPYGEYSSLEAGDRVGIGWVTDSRQQSVGIYQIVRINRGPLWADATVEWVRDERW